MADVRTIQIDFGTCAPQKQHVYLPLGTFIYQIDGVQNGLCEMKYGGEVENPNWDQSLTTSCSVPVTLGVTTFNITSESQGFIELTSIKKYCGQTQELPRVINLFPLVQLAFVLILALAGFLIYRKLKNKFRKVD